MAHQDGGKTRSKVISHARHAVGKRRSGLAGCSAGDQKAGAAWRPEADDAEHDEDRGRSQRDWLQKAEKQLRKAHRSIVEEPRAKGDITCWVDLTCGPKPGFLLALA